VWLLSGSLEVLLEVLARVLVAGQDVERVTVDLDVAAKRHVSRCDECHAVVHVLVLPSLQELAFHDAGVLLSRLINRDAVIGQVERNDEASVEVFRNPSIEFGGVPQDLLVVVNRLEKVTFGLVRVELVELAK
jgi:hypothetical protein